MNTAGRAAALRAAAWLSVMLLVLVVASPAVASGGSSGGPERAAPSQGTNSGCFGSPTVTSTVPSDMAGLTNQNDANCFAWQQFIALNWPANPSTCAADTSAGPAEFGVPGSTATVVWETYKESTEIFQPHAAPPAGWCSPQPLPATLKAGGNTAGLRPTSPHGYKVLTQDSKFSPASLPLQFGVTTEAGTGGAWLTAQSGHLTVYEIRVNQDEFSYIKNNTLYDASVQQSFALSPGLGLPDGSPVFSSYGLIGSIELKAAWIELDDPSLWPNFKISQAIVSYESGPPKLVTVGLVGLHIIHKTPKGQQFVWATFEHVNNDPSTTDLSSKNLKSWYTYYNLQCSPTTDHYHCVPNAQPVPGVDPTSAPVQVVRETPISSVPNTNNIVGLNQYVWAEIAAANSQSVFLNYQLVSTVWPNSNTPIPPPSPPPPGCRIPLPPGQPTPPQGVFNTTMETYFQTSTAITTCLSCHASAPIANVSALRGLKLAAPRPDALGALSSCIESSPGPSASPLAADYSFLFHRAETGPPRARSGSRRLPVALGVGVGGAAVLVGAAALVRRRMAR